MVILLKSVPTKEELATLESELGKIAGITRVITWPAADNNQSYVEVVLAKGTAEPDVETPIAAVVAKLGLTR